MPPTERQYPNLPIKRGGVRRSAEVLLAEGVGGARADAAVRLVGVAVLLWKNKKRRKTTLQHRSTEATSHDQSDKI
jgi:hypothetical protein